MHQPMRILHLEDDPIDAELVSASLSTEGIESEIVRVDTYEGFVNALQCGEFDIIIADYSLPAFDGISALEIAKGKCPDTPFLFLTGKMGEELAIEMLKSGATDYILKQRMSRLVPSVRRALKETEEKVKRRQAEEELRRYHERLEELVKERTSELEKANAQLELANRDLESFSYTASHDLRTPLISIDGFSRMVLEDYGDRLDDEGRRLLNIVRDNAKKMGQLIDDILAFSRLGTKGLALLPINVGSLVRRVFEELRPAFPGREVSLEVRPVPDCCGDLPMIRQVFVNLISNAFKFTKGREKALIEAGGGREGDENVYYVRDNGIGFSMENADRLFKIFHRLHGSKEFEGTGVGLAIVQRIVEKHGGRVWAEGSPGHGATFFIAIPAGGCPEADSAGK